MEKPSSAALGPWRRFAEGIASSVIGAVICSLAGSLIAGSAGAELVKAPLAKGLYASAVLFGIYLLGSGGYLSFRRLKRGTEVSPRTPEAEPPQKLAIRILDAIAGDESIYIGSPGDAGIYLRVRAVNRTLPAVTVGTWKLDLFRGEEHWKIAFAQTLVTGPGFRRLRLGPSETNKESVGRGFEEKPIDAGASPEGWLRFAVEGVLLQYIFGATFLLRAVDDLGNTSSCKMAPGEWLAPVQLNP
ncbi:MAG: hypothetical protein ACRD3T_16780 [Terriglobia bacterium]